MSNHKTGISLVIVAFAVLASGFVVWDRLGWITIPAYAAQHTGESVEKQQTAILELLKSQKIALDLLQEGQDRNQDQWECDETDEELEVLEVSLIEVSSPEKRAKLNRQKQKLNGVWDRLDCTRFTD